MRRLTSADNGTTITVEPGETIELRLAQLGGTGYLWSVASSSNVVVVDDHLETGEEPQPPGDAATRVFRVRLSRPGRGHLRLVRSRPWETTGQGDAHFQIDLA